MEVKAGSADDDLARYTRQIERYVDYVAQCAAGANSCNIKADRYVVVAIFNGLTTASAAQTIANTSFGGVPVIVVYCKADCDTANPKFAIAYAGISEADAKKIACEMGYTQFCGGGLASGSTGSGGIQPSDPIIIIPSYPPDPVCFGNNICIQ